jgi:hypothetical protein
MKAAEAFNSLCNDLIGMPISYIWRGHGSAMFIEIGDLSPKQRRDGTPGHPQGDISLGVEWSWRVEDARSIACGSWSEESLWEPALDRLRNAEIIGCESFGFLPEIAVTTTAGLRFITFSTTDGQPQWHLIDRRGEKARWFTVRDGRLHLGDGTEPAF